MYGVLDDLNHSIELLRKANEACDHTFLRSTDRPFNMEIGSKLCRRYTRTRNSADLDEAVQLLTESLGERNDVDAAELSNLGVALLTRYNETGDETDLFRAVDLQTRAMDIANIDNQSRPVVCNNAANALAAAGHATNDLQFAQRATALYHSAVRLTVDGSPRLSANEYNLARFLQARAEKTGDDSLVAPAVAAYRNAVAHGLDNSLEWALTAGRLWGAWAVARGTWDEASMAHTSALEAAEQLFRGQLLRAEKESWLTDSQGLPAEAAYALVRAGRLEEAVVALEAGRSLLLSEVLERDRAGLDRLVATGHADLVERYRAATTALDEAMRLGAAPAELRAGRGEIDDAIEAFRAISGYERFMLRPTIADVRRAVPADAVVVYLAAAEPAGVALVVDANGNIQAIELPGVTSAALRRRFQALVDARSGYLLEASAWEGTLDAITRWSWTAIAEPVISIAGHARKVVFISSGFLSMLPLHAAWWAAPDGTRHYLLDERTVTYTPNVRALEVTAQIAARVPAEHLLVIADPRPTAQEPIGYARTETAWARRWFSSSTVLRAEDAHRPAVVVALTRAQVQHFICHGRADTANPLQGGLILAHNEELTLREILALRLGHSGAGARLAILSACDTDLPGTALPDEVIGLPTGLIQAGFAGVVATQWAVRSEAISLLMARFYQLWRAEHHEPTEALCAAQRWLRDTTNTEKICDLASALTDGPDDDLADLVRSLRLRDPDDRPYQRPTDWAALSYHGT